MVSKLRDDTPRTRQAAINCLNGPLALPEDVLHLIAAQLKDTDYAINEAASEVLKRQKFLSDKTLQVAAELLRK